MPFRCHSFDIDVTWHTVHPRKEQNTVWGQGVHRAASRLGPKGGLPSQEERSQPGEGRGRPGNRDQGVHRAASRLGPKGALASQEERSQPGEVWILLDVRCQRLDLDVELNVFIG